MFAVQDMANLKQKRCGSSVKILMEIMVPNSPIFLGQTTHVWWGYFTLGLPWFNDPVDALTMLRGWIHRWRCFIYPYTIICINMYVIYMCVCVLYVYIQINPSGTWCRHFGYTHRQASSTGAWAGFSSSLPLILTLTCYGGPSFLHIGPCKNGPDQLKVFHSRHFFWQHFFFFWEGYVPNASQVPNSQQSQKKHWIIPNIAKHELFLILRVVDKEGNIPFGSSKL